ncbi:MAG TPA: DUF2877 domain-containing protein [Hyphomicrobiaceae bacterium]
MTPLRVEGWGPHARRFATRHCVGRIAAVFERSLHIEANGDFLCLGDASIGRGPLNAFVSTEAWARLGRAVPPVGSTVLVDHRRFRIGPASINIAEAKLWRPAPWPQAPDRRRVAEGVDRFTQLCVARAPGDGLARMVLAPTVGSGTALERVALPRIGRMRAWLDACRFPPAHHTPPVDLLGLGPGLTPSGDDVLCGALVALHAVGRADALGLLARAIDKAAPAATSRLSGAFLRAAAEGLGAEPLHETICELLSGRAESLARHLEALGHIGHTSGWDALAGAVLVLQAFGTIAVQSAGVASSELSL